MRAIPALIWKELRERQWAFVAGGALFVALPTILTVLFARRASGLGDLAFGLVLALGGVYAILVSAHSASSDLGPGLEHFWRSRPIRVAEWSAVKYVIGALVVLLVTASALAIEAVLVLRWGLGSPGDQLAMLLGHSFSLLLVYSVGFLAGSIVGEPLKAALLSLPAALLVYFLPVLIPALERFSVINLLGGDWPRPQLGSGLTAGVIGREDSRVGFPMPGGAWLVVPGAYGPFVLGHLAVSAVLGGLAWLALRFRWRLEPGQKTLAFTLGGVAMALLALAGGQVGSNLEPRGVHELPPGARDCAVVRIDQRDGAGILTRFHWPERWIDRWYGLSIQKLDASVSPLRLGSPVVVPGRFQGHDGWGHELHMAWTPENPERAYLLIEKPESQQAEERSTGVRSGIELVTLDLVLRARSPVKHRLELLEHLPGSRALDRAMPQPHVCRGILYIADVESNPNTRVLRIDLRDRDTPVLLDVLEVDRAVFRIDADGVPESRGLLAIPGLNPRERLEATFALLGPYSVPCIDRDLLITWDHRRGLETFGIELSSADRAVFKRLGQRRPTPLERLRSLSPGASFLRDGHFYALSRDGMTVYDLRNPARPRRLGHYAAPREDFRAISPLPSGDVLVAGRSLHVVAPPRTERRDRR